MRLQSLLGIGRAPSDLSEHERWLLDEWHDDALAKYDGAETSANELYDGFGAGRTFKRFMERNAKEDVDVSKADMIAFLDSKGYRSNRVCGELRFHGIRQVIGGSVRSHNYMA